MADRIEDYAIIGDCETAALVSKRGSIDWLCWPRFDSGALFAALLGSPDNGRWSLKTIDDRARISRRYRGNTLILDTTIATREGEVAVTDFMPVRSNTNSDLVRIVTGRRGRVEMTTELVLRFDYGSTIPWVTRPQDGMLQAVAGPNMVIVRSEVPLEAVDRTHRGRFTVNSGQSVAFVMCWGPSYRPPPTPIDASIALESTEKFWKGWSEKYDCAGKYSDAVMRSLITLKALTYQPTGGLTAAVTTSLPEMLGGSRNWDYRFCWLRDATFSLLALMDSGYYREAAAWRTWLHRAIAGDPAQVQIMYGLTGERMLPEQEIPWLQGYEGSRPVRIGNAAAGQLQLDVYGEVMDALFQGRNGPLEGEPDAWDLQLKLLEHLETMWREPDHGIWEVRGGPHHFTHSKVMAWVAFDRAIQSVELFGLHGPIDRWRAVRAKIHDEVCSEGYDREQEAFTQRYGAPDLDASALLIPLVGFLPPSDPRVGKTVEAIMKGLMHHGLVRRYDPERTPDGMSGREGAFLACSFWLADNLLLLGRRQKARELFERLLLLRNDVGLLAEEYDPIAKRMLGNFPQAFSHVSLIDTAHNLAHSGAPAEQRSGRKAASAALQPAGQ